MSAWDDLQDRAVLRLVDAIDAGHKRIVFVGPTGFGKTRCIEKLIRRLYEVGLGSSIYTNRRALVSQLTAALSEARIPHGVRAAGYESDLNALVQISSMPTEASRVLKSKKWELHNAAVALIDEAHLQTGDQALEIIKRHTERGCAVIGVTATPLDLGGIYTHLIEAASVSECMKVGALVPALHYAPDEPDMKAWKKLNKDVRGITDGADLTENQVRAIMGPRHLIFGRVWTHFEKLNPDRRPTILFAPGVDESIWFAEEFTKRGVPAAHIDGENVWVDGELRPTTDERRQEILDDSRNGRLVVLCNRFVLREGIDAPWLGHGILATIFGSLQSYLQSVGRLLRTFPGMASVSLQDHGGNWWRHGSANSDREWKLGLTAEQAYDLRANRIRTEVEQAPFLCPSCGRVWIAGIVCSPARGGCGFQLPVGKKSRPVVSTDGELKVIEDDVFPARRISKRHDGESLWERTFYRAKSKKWDATFREAEAFFFREYHAWPDPSWPFMPKNPDDRQAKVRLLTNERLIPKERTGG